MRFDLRTSADADATELAAAAIEMSEWAEQHGCLSVAFSEHHCCDDGYLPSPLMMASAVAARTSTLPIMIAAAILPFYDPVRLAEDLLVLDHISRGRVSVIFGMGYRAEEFDLYGVSMSDRARIAEERLPLLLAALREGKIDDGAHRGKLAPKPFSPEGPKVIYGGSSAAAARRAARFELDFIAQSGDESLREAYMDEIGRTGGTPGSVMIPGKDTPLALFVADNVDQAWDELGPYLLHDAMTYSAWNPDDEHTVSIDRSTTVEQLRAEAGSHRIVTVEQAREELATFGYLNLHPLCGGIPPELAWKHLRLAVDEVINA